MQLTLLLLQCLESLIPYEDTSSTVGINKCELVLRNCSRLLPLVYKTIDIIDKYYINIVNIKLIVISIVSCLAHIPLDVIAASITQLSSNLYHEPGYISFNPTINDHIDCILHLYSKIHLLVYQLSQIKSSTK